MTPDSILETARPRYDDILVVGLGGTGIRAVRTILAYGHLPSDGRQPYDAALARAIDQQKIVPVGIDTDMSEFGYKKLRIEAFPRALKPLITQKIIPDTYPIINQVVKIPREGMSEQIRNVRGLSRRSRSNSEERITDDERVAELIRDFLPIQDKLYDTMLPADGEASEGAGQLRALGRIAFLSGMQSIMSTLLEAKTKIGPQTSHRKLRVALFCSLAGGTGSGMFLDVAIMLRRLIAPNAHISAYLLLPEVFESKSIVSRIWPNTFAALKEMNQIARPQNEKPITINYRMNDIDNEITIQRGDPPIMDDVYLFNDTAGLVDWDPQSPERSNDQRTEAAARAMADVALALSRREIIDKNKNRQNLLVGHKLGSDVSRRFYHAAAAAQLRPREANNLAAVVVRATWQRFREERIDGLEHDLKIDPSLSSAEAFITHLKGTTLENENPNTVKSVFEKQWRPSENILINIQELLKNIREQNDNDAIYSRLDQIERKFDSEAFGNVLKEYKIDIYTRPAVDSISRIRNHKKAMLEKTTYFEVPFVDVFRSYLLERTEVLENLVNSIEEEISSGRHLKLDVTDQLTTFISHLRALPKESPPRRSFRVETPKAFFRQTSTFQAAIGRGDAQAIADRRVRFFGPGQLNEDFAETLSGLVGNLETEIANLLSAEGNGINVNIKPIMNAAVGEWIQSSHVTKILDDLEKILEKSRSNYTYRYEVLKNADQFFGRKGWDISDSQSEIEEFEEIFKPIVAIFSDVIGSSDDVVSTMDGDTRRTVTTQRKQLSDRITRLIKERLPEYNKSLELSVENVQEIAKEIRDIVRSEEEYTINKKHIHHIIANSAYDDWFTRKDDIINTKNEIGIEKLKEELESVSAAVEGFIDYFMNRPEFELSKFGGEKGIEKTVAACNYSPFMPGSAPGALNARYATLAMPYIEDAPQDGNDNGVFSIISRIIKRELTADPIEADRSRVPILLYESRYQAAFQVSNIARYKRLYDELEPEERPLYHVIRGAEEFPSPISTEVVIDRTTIKRDWECEEHGTTPYRVADAEDECPRCLREYQEGTRPWKDVSRRNDYTEFYWPNPKDPDGRPIKIPSLMEPYFWDGVPDDERGRNGRQGDFENKIQEWKLPNDLLNKSWDPLDPPRLLFPSVLNPETQKMEWVRREPDADNGFVCFGQENDPLHECYHCGFPILTSANEGEMVSPKTCPRCRRSLKYCYYCSHQDRKLFAPMTRNGQAVERCPRCTNTMRDPHVG